MSLLLSCQDVAKAYGARTLFQRISFGVRAGDRIGMIGPNGAGKSTLLKILAGSESPDAGRVAVSTQAHVAYVPQEDVFDPERAVEAILAAAVRDPHLEAHERMTAARVLLGKIGFADPMQTAGTLSGGWRKRLAIACQLINQPNLLLLDEPTNHLDVAGIDWLEQLLASAPFAYLAISHDRYFLQQISRRVIELNPQYPDGLLTAEGRYADFLEQREQFLAGQRHQQAALANRVRGEIEWLRRGPKARTTKSYGRIKTAHALIDALADVTARNNATGRARIDFAASERRTKQLVQAHGIAKALGGRTLFTALDVALSPGMKLGLLGDNGSGKSTLLQLLRGTLTPDAGVIDRAEQLRMVYYDQNRAQLDNTQTLQQALTPHGDQVMFRGQAMHVVSWARRFLFRAEQLPLRVSELSGGERARILIARLMLEPADVLLLDEPTNDLDIPTLEVLEDNLLEFPGALVLVTHDRALLDRVSTHLLAIEEHGEATYYADVAQWQQAQRDAARAERAAAVAASERRSAPRAATKLSYREQREFEGMEAVIEAAEAHVTQWQCVLNDPANAAQATVLHDACAQLEAAQRQVETLYARWSALEAKQAGTMAVSEDA